MKLEELISKYDASLSKTFEEETILCSSTNLFALLQSLKDAGYEMLIDISSVHFQDEIPNSDDLPPLPGKPPEKQDHFRVVYEVLNFNTRHYLRIASQIKGQEHVPSVTSLWPSANWLEREIYDLMGIFFDNHPDLRRILMPEDWPSHPLRKDYPIRGQGERIYRSPAR